MKVAPCLFLLALLLACGRGGASEPQEGWPVVLDAQPSGGVRHPSIGDVDGDGLPEVIVGMLGRYVYALRLDGSVLPGWPFVLATGAVERHAVVGDIDGNGGVEVVFAQRSPSKVHAVSAAGVEKPGWPVSLTPHMNDAVHLSLGDLDGDGILEVIFFDERNTVHAYRGDGTPVEGWPVAVGPNIGQSGSGPAGLAVGDVDFNSVSEVIATVVYWDGVYLPSPTFVLEGDGSVRQGWPVSPEPPGVLSYPAIADLNGDFACEIMGGNWSVVNILSSDGSAFHSPYSLYQAGRPVACADVNGDGRLEVIVPGNTLTVVDTIYGFVAQTDSSTYSLYDGISVGDVDGDGNSEIAAWSRRFQGQALAAVHLYTSGLEELPGWPKTFPYQDMGFVWATAMADLDGDNDLEIIHTHGYTVYVWDQPNPTGNPVHVEWAMIGHDSYKSHFYHTGAIPVPVFLRGDGNRDGMVDVADAGALLLYLFGTYETNCAAQMDFDADGDINVGDALGVLFYAFLGGPSPAAGPFPDCGPAPEGQAVPCSLTECP